MTTVYGYQVRDDITPGRAYTVTTPAGVSAKRFGDAVELIRGIGERPGSTAEFSAVDMTWTVTIAADGKNAAEDLQLAEAKYGATVEAIEEPSAYAEASDDQAAINTTFLADPFAGIPNADDTERHQFDKPAP